MLIAGPWFAPMMFSEPGVGFVGRFQKNQHADKLWHFRTRTPVSCARFTLRAIIRIVHKTQSGLEEAGRISGSQIWVWAPNCSEQCRWMM
jgi:hypothetical protein